MWKCELTGEKHSRVLWACERIELKNKRSNVFLLNNPQFVMNPARCGDCIHLKDQKELREHANL